MTKKYFLYFLLVFLLTSFISAAVIRDDLHLNIQTTNSAGSVVTGTFNFTFNISTSSDCSNIIYSNKTTLTTDSRGIISYYLENVNLNFSEQYWLCYYRDGTLINASKIARVPYTFTAKNISAEGIKNDSNLNLVGFNITGSSGLFSWLGSLTSRIAELFIQNISFIGNINGSGNITTTGRIGIGTEYPSNALDVRGIGNFSGILYYNNQTPITSLNSTDLALSINTTANIQNLLNSTGIYSTYNASYDTGIKSIVPIWINDSFQTKLNLSYPQFVNISGVMYVNSTSGNVGIGTTSPLGKLHVVTSSTTGYTNEIILGGYPTSNNYQLRLGTNILAGTVDYFFRTTDDGGATQKEMLYFDTSTGNVGIGTTGPGQLLDVQSTTHNRIRIGSSLASPSLGLEFTESGVAKGYIQRQSGNRISFYAGDGTTEDMVILDTGNVGIGTTAPGNLLHVNSGATPSVSQMRLTANAAGSLSATSYAADNTWIGFDTDFSSNVHVARHTSAALLYKVADTLRIYGNTGLTSGNSFTPTARVTVDLSNGNVGIGTTSPLSTLHVAGNLTLDNGGVGGPSTVAASGIYFRNSTGGANLAMWKPSGNALRIDNPDGPIAIDLRNAHDFYVYNATSGTYYFFVEGGSGNVGIGTTTPGGKLEVAGTGAIGIRLPYLDIRSDNTYSTDRSYIRGLTDHLVISAGGTGTGTLYLNYADAGTAGSINFRNGGMTLSTGNNLYAAGTGQFGANAVIGSGITGGYYQDPTNGAYRAIVGSGVTNGYYFQTNGGGATTMYVGLGGTYNGNVGIGTTSPGGKLEVSGGNLKMTSGNINLNGNYLSGDGDSEGITVNTAGAVITPSYYQFGAISTATASLCYSGAPSYNILRCSSSARFKENIINYEINKTKLFQLQPRIYHRTDDDVIEVGLIAEEVAEILSEFVVYEYNDNETKKEIPFDVKYKNLGILSFPILKEHDIIITQLESENFQLKTELTSLKTELCLKDKTYSWCK